MKKFWLIKNSAKIALKLISIEIGQKKTGLVKRQFRPIYGCIRPFKVINNRSELLNAVLKHLKPIKELLEPFRVL